VHALVVAVSVEPGREEEGVQYVNTDVVPLVKQSPGIVSGYWLSPTNGQGLAMLLFESQEAAQAAAAMVPNGPRPDFAKFDTIEVREVVAQI
jgi:hypothetical protein